MLHHSTDMKCFPERLLPQCFMSYDVGRRASGGSARHQPNFLLSFLPLSYPVDKPTLTDHPPISIVLTDTPPVPRVSFLLFRPSSESALTGCASNFLFTSPCTFIFRVHHDWPRWTYWSRGERIGALCEPTISLDQLVLNVFRMLLICRPIVTTERSGLRYILMKFLLFLAGFQRNSSSLVRANFLHNTYYQACSTTAHQYQTFLSGRIQPFSNMSTQRRLRINTQAQMVDPLEQRFSSPSLVPGMGLMSLLSMLLNIEEKSYDQQYSPRRMSFPRSNYPRIVVTPAPESGIAT